MKGSIEKQAMAEVPGILANFLELPENKMNVVPQGRKIGPNFLVKASGYHFLVECKSTAARAPLLMALRQVSEIKDSFKKDAVPLIVVPYMGESGMDFCQDHDLSWIDLSGNAHIKAPGLLLRVEGRPNRFKNVGRPAKIFGP